MWVRTIGALVALGAASSRASGLDSTTPNVEVQAAFPKENPLGQVVNSKANGLLIGFRNNEDHPYTLERVTGSFRRLDGTHKPLRNTTTATFAALIPPNTTEPVVIRYDFFSQLRPSEVQLTVWADITEEQTSAIKRHMGSKKVSHQFVAFDAPVTIVEAPSSFFDVQLLGTYLMVAILVGAAGWLLLPVFQSWFGLKPAAKKSKRTGTARPAPPGAKSAASTSTGREAPAQSYDESWIPDLHKKKTAPQVVRATGRGNAVEVISGSEAEATDGSASGKTRKRRAR